MTEPNPPLLVLGLPRTGTTWLASLLAVGLGGPYVHEPFNADLDDDQVEWWLTWLDGAAQRRFGSAFDVAMVDPGPGPQPVVKDVHAIFALARLAIERDLPVVICIRHPCAVVNSRLELGWTSSASRNLRWLLDQPALVVDGPLAPFVGHLTACSGRPASTIAAVWAATYHVLRQASPVRVAWITHERTCLAPIDELDRAVAGLGLGWDPNTGLDPVRTWLADHDRTSIDQEQQYRITAEQPDRWRAVLAPELVTEVLDAVAPFGLPVEP